MYISEDTLLPSGNSTWLLMENHIFFMGIPLYPLFVGDFPYSSNHFQMRQDTEVHIELNPVEPFLDSHRLDGKKQLYPIVALLLFRRRFQTGCNVTIGFKT